MKDIPKIFIFMAKILVAMIVLYGCSTGIGYLASYLPVSAEWASKIVMLIVVIVLIVLITGTANKYLFVGVNTKAFQDKQKRYLNQFTLFSTVIMQVIIPLMVPITNLSIFSGSPASIPQLLIKSIYSALWLSFIYSYMLRLEHQRAAEEEKAK